MPCKPLVMRQRLYREIGIGDAGAEERIEIDTAGGNDPEQEETDCTQVVERIQPITKKRLKRASQP